MEAAFCIVWVSTTHIHKFQLCESNLVMQRGHCWMVLTVLLRPLAASQGSMCTSLVNVVLVISDCWQSRSGQTWKSIHQISLLLCTCILYFVQDRDHVHGSCQCMYMHVTCCKLHIANYFHYWPCTAFLFSVAVHQEESSQSEQNQLWWAIYSFD